MGHRALVAVEESAGRYALYRDQWGAAALLDGEDAASVVTRAVDAGRRVDTDLTVRGVLDALDPRECEALVVREARGAVSVFLVVRPGLELASGTAGDGAVALVPLADPAQGRRLLRFLRAAKSHLGDAVDAGALSGPGAVATLRAMLAEHPAVPAETMWIPAEDGR